MSFNRGIDNCSRFRSLNLVNRCHERAPVTIKVMTVSLIPDRASAQGTSEIRESQARLSCWSKVLRHGGFAARSVFPGLSPALVPGT